MIPQRRRPTHLTSGQIDIQASFILLRRIIQPQLSTELLDPWFDLLDSARGMIPLADDDMQMSLSSRLSIPDPRLQDVLGFFDELPVEIDRVLGHAAGRVILPEDVLGGLFVVGVLLALVFFTFVREGLG